MCTLIILFKLIRGYPIVALHARYVRRGSVEYPPRVIRGERLIFAPIDQRSQGTWIGFNDEGLLIAVTDQETGGRGGARRSRGRLILEVLDRFEDAKSAADYLQQDEVRRSYRRANFAVLDREEGWHIIWDERSLRRTLKEGVYAITNLTMLPWVKRTGAIEETWRYARERELRALELARDIDPTDPEGAFNKVLEIARDHGRRRGRGSICYHRPSGEWFQSSATMVAVAERIEDSRIFYCPGNPCEGEFRDYSSLIGEALRGGSGIG